MKRIVSLLLLMNFLIGFSQDYQTIHSNDINYFSEADSSYILATRIDSFDVQGNDSIFYGFKTLRRNDTASAISYCSHTSGAPWFGEKVIIKDNGMNLYFNQDDDTIYINTQAALNDTFTVYNYGSGEWIKAAVTAHDTMTVLGIQDSVKMLTLFSNKSGFAFEDTTLHIGKNLGFIEILPFYSFPHIYDSNIDFLISNYIPAKIEDPMMLVGMEQQGLGIHRLKKSDYFNQSTGDVIKNILDEDEYNGATLSAYNYSNYEWHVQSVNDYSPDSIQYNFEIYVETNWYNSIPPPGYFGNTLDTFQYSKTIKNLDNFLHSHLPEEYYDSLSNTEFNDGTGLRYYFLDDLRCRNYMMVNDCGEINEGIIAEQGKKSADGNGDSTCFGNVFVEPSTYNIFHKQNAGGPYTHYTSANAGYWLDFSGKVAYYDVGGNSCGENWFVSISKEEQQEFVVYPNPSNGLIYLDLNEEFKNADIRVFNLQGEIVYNNYLSTNSIDLTHLPNGIYLLQLSSDRGWVSRKIVLQK